MISVNSNGCFTCDVFTKITGFSQNIVYGATAKTNVMNTMTSKCTSGEGTIADPSKGIIEAGGHSYSSYKFRISPSEISNEGNNKCS